MPGLVSPVELNESVVWVDKNRPKLIMLSSKLKTRKEENSIKLAKVLDDLLALFPSELIKYEAKISKIRSKIEEVSKAYPKSQFSASTDSSGSKSDSRVSSTLTSVEINTFDSDSTTTTMLDYISPAESSNKKPLDEVLSELLSKLQSVLDQPMSHIGFLENLLKRDISTIESYIGSEFDEKPIDKQLNHILKSLRNSMQTLYIFVTSSREKTRLHDLIETCCIAASNCMKYLPKKKHSIDWSDSSGPFKKIKATVINPSTTTNMDHLSEYGELADVSH